MQSQPPQAAQPTPQLSTTTTVLVHSLETAFLLALITGGLAGYQAVQSGLAPSYVIAAIALPIGGILAKWAQSSVLSNAIAKQNALIAVSDLAQHILPMHTLVAAMNEDMGTLFTHLNTQAHSQPSPDVLAKVATLAAMVPALQQTLTAASTATTLAPAPAQAAIPPPGLPAGASVPKFIQDQVQQLVQQSGTTSAIQPAQPNFMLDQMTTQSVPIVPQAQPFPQGQLPFPVPQQGISWNTAGVPIVSAQ